MTLCTEQDCLCFPHPQLACSVSQTAAPVPVAHIMPHVMLSCQLGNQAHGGVLPSACSMVLQGVVAAKRERARAERTKREADAALLEVQQYEPPSDDGGGLGDLQGEVNEAKEELDRRLRPMVRGRCMSTAKQHLLNVLLACAT